MKKPKILVVGSLVMDLIVSANRIPNSGESVFGKSFSTAPGGKGANQAVQAARLGADVTMVGRVGSDGFGKELKSTMLASGINVDHVLETEGVSSAVGNVLLEAQEGQQTKNRIIIVPGANMEVKPSDVAFLKDTIQNYDIVLLQFEIPMEINEIVAEYAFDKGVKVMLNPAPSAPVSNKLLSYLTYIAPNEHEASDITGIKIGSVGKTVNKDDLEKAVYVFKSKGVKNIIVTLGSAGSAIYTATEQIYEPSVSGITAVDPTAAGDSFIGAFTFGVCAGLKNDQALQLANHVGALTVSHMGAMPSLQKLDKVVSFMKERGFNKFNPEILKNI